MSRNYYSRQIHSKHGSRNMHAVRSRVLAVTDVTGGERKSRRSIHVTITLTPQVGYPYIGAPARLGRFVSGTSRMTFCGISLSRVHDNTSTITPASTFLFFRDRVDEELFLLHLCAVGAELLRFFFFKFSLVASIKRRRAFFRICDKKMSSMENNAVNVRAAALPRGFS